MDKAQVSALLARNPYAVTRAIVLLWSYQELHERSARRTTDLNGRGFNAAADLDKIAYMVRWVLRLSPNVAEADMNRAVARYLQSNARQYRCLSGSYLEDGRKLAAYHWRQLDAAAAAKAAAERIPF